MICELTVTFCFWTFLEIINTNLTKMNTKQIEKQLIHDLFVDVENYNHSVPLLLLSIEFMINNIPFDFDHFKGILVVNLIYLCCQISYSLRHRVAVYSGVNWSESPL